MADHSDAAAHVAYTDLREWLAAADRLGEVRTVTGANTEEDMGLAAEAVVRAALERAGWRLRAFAPPE